MTHTFKTRLHRAQISVFDFTGKHAYGAGSAAGQLTFSAAVLPSSAHHATTFAGHQIYYGDDIMTALAYIGNAIGIPSQQLAAKLPSRMANYLPH